MPDPETVEELAALREAEEAIVWAVPVSPEAETRRVETLARVRRELERVEKAAK